MKRVSSINEVWQAMLRGKRIAKRCVSKALRDDLMFWAKMNGRRIISSGRNFVLTT